MWQRNRACFNLFKALLLQGLVERAAYIVYDIRCLRNIPKDKAYPFTFFAYSRVVHLAQSFTYLKMFNVAIF